jgi:ABC-type sugar transport system ATPase subunit
MDGAYTQPAAGDAIISVRNLHKWYSGVHALKGVSLDVRRNEALGLWATTARASPR